jgi:hypothetical protein
MNKLEELHLDELYKHEYEEIPNSALYKFNYEEAAVKSSEITTDVAVKFAQWIDNSPFTYYDEENIWSSIATEEKKTNEALFQEFINNHYEK